ncbi:Uncharacterised protein [Mycoplasmopsis bovigenitalium]|uniref:Uncharacterized protein n=1 Tax=Mycoplasmopsis bovigenitalium TaxID=2112 RepID=A0A449A8S6_9BACT|nr:hypothetical protein [Mycoplasmopsis bovigenitalium]VEU60658.1 Uncharacterised protein [Mycoplasmopsis bovigenitalium]
MNKKYWPIVSILYCSILLVIPMVVVWLTSTSDFNGQKINNFYAILFTPIAIGFFSISLAILLTYFNLLKIDTFKYLIPLTAIFLTIILSSLTNLSIFWRMFITLVLAIIFSLLTNWIIYIIKDKLNNLKKQNNNTAIE